VRQILLLVLFFLIGCAPAPMAIDELLHQMDARLAWMDEVAAWKRANQRRVADPIREAALLMEVRKQADARGLDPELAARFMQSQMDAAKAFQEVWLAADSAPVSHPGIDIVDIRQELDHLTPALLDALQRAQAIDPELIHERAAVVLAHYPKAVRQQALGWVPQSSRSD